MTTDELTDIDDLRAEIDRLDSETLAAVKRRTEVSQSIGKVRMASGGTRLVHSREMAVIERYSALGADGSTMALVGALLGGGLAATSQAAKTTTRAAINTSPEPFSNIGMSLLEDGLVVGAVWLATNHPVVFGILLVIAVVLMWIVTWMLFKFLRAVFRRMSTLFSAAPKEV